MLDPETFLTELYVLVDDFCKTQPPVSHPGPSSGLSTSEIVTLAIYGQATHFPSERAFHRHASRRLRPLFPGLPGRDRFNRLLRACGEVLTAFALHLGRLLATGDDRAFEVLDGTGLVVRNAKRRGAGWLFGQADIGWCTRLGWYEGLRLLVSVTPTGGITGWGVGPASTNDRVLAETFFAARAVPHPGLPSVGVPTSDCYVADMGFSGKRCQLRWATEAGAVVISPPQSNSKRAWPKRLKRWLAAIRQVIEAVNDRLLFACGLDRERPHALDGLQARLAAAIGLHNACCWLNRHLGRGPLQFADLIDW
jgi:hypothetical protein